MTQGCPIPIPDIQLWLLMPSQYHVLLIRRPSLSGYKSIGPVGPSLCYGTDRASCDCCVVSQKWVDFSRKELTCLKRIRMGGNMNPQELL